MAGHVFVSYSQADGEYVDQVLAYLDALGIPTWIDRERLGDADRWNRVIRDQVDSCAAMIVVMTPEAEDSEWVGMEIERARTTGRPIFPLLLSGGPLFALGTLQYDDVRARTDPSPRFTARLLAAVGPVIGPVTTSPVVVVPPAPAVEEPPPVAPVPVPVRAPGPVALSEVDAVPRRRRTGWRVAAAAAVALLLTIALLVVLTRSDGSSGTPTTNAAPPGVASRETVGCD